MEIIISVQTVMDMDLLTNTTKLEWYPAKDAGDPTDSVTCRKVNIAIYRLGDNLVSVSSTVCDD